MRRRYNILIIDIFAIVVICAGLVWIILISSRKQCSIGEQTYQLTRAQGVIIEYMVKNNKIPRREVFRAKKDALYIWPQDIYELNPLLYDPIRMKDQRLAIKQAFNSLPIQYISCKDCFVLISPGRDGYYDNDIRNRIEQELNAGNRDKAIKYMKDNSYDPTNGLISKGDIYIGTGDRYAGTKDFHEINKLYMVDK